MNFFAAVFLIPILPWPEAAAYIARLCLADLKGMIRSFQFKT